ncbi:hypothetical protein H2200_011549 [Cladophialophora chaetospira]|uniref:U4/U6.U5 small nuclear ribonucleoprotein 27kDa protein domain-containing protein n=1 Tax=Cladophialophora chaetospira TaxID=386627 RepID=A0AA39CD92_9EURO|nr:hypothetical protein H2200_011549 [Cladophialophora chaetospira]
MSFFTNLPTYLLASVAFLGAFSRFTHGEHTPRFYAFQEYHAVDDGSTVAKVIPVLDLIVGLSLLFGGRAIRLCAASFSLLSFGMGLAIQLNAEKERAKRTATAAGLDDEERPASRPSSSGRDYKPRPRDIREDDHRGSRRDDDRRRRSRSRDTPDQRGERSGSREKPHRDRERDRDRDRDKHRDRDRDRDRDRPRGGRDRDLNGHSRRDRSRSRDRARDSKGKDSSAVHVLQRSHDTDHRGARSNRHSRSRSPLRNGDGPSARTRSPLKRNDHDRDRDKGRDRPSKREEDESRRTKLKEESPSSTNRPPKPITNGDAMAIDEDSEDARLRKMMGFVSFNTTQNKKVPGNQIYGVRKEKKTEYRQYMNRVGGFNRPLSPSRGA